MREKEEKGAGRGRIRVRVKKLWKGDYGRIGGVSTNQYPTALIITLRCARLLF
jgi:hypothetical protein